MTFFPIKGFAPDADPTEPGILKEIVSLVPTTRGMEAFPQGATTTLPALSATAIAATSVQDLNGTVRTYAASSDTIWQAETSSWTAQATALTTATRVRFAQFGNATLATNDADSILRSTGGAFTEISGAPKAAIVEIIDRQAIALNTNDSTFGDQGDRWRTSAQDDETDWAINTSTLAASGRLVDSPGPITAGRKLGGDVVVYKDNSMYLGRFTGAPIVIQFSMVDDQIGAPSQEAVVRTEALHFFMGGDDFYVFDGSRPRSLGTGKVRDWFFNTQLDRDNRTKVVGVLDRENTRIFWWYPSQDGDGSLDRWIAYNWKSDQWGKCELTVQYIFEYLQNTGITYDTLGDAYATYDDLPAITYDAKVWNSSAQFMAYFDTSNRLKTLNAAAGSSRAVLWDIGDDQNYIFLNRVRPRFVVSPTSGTLNNAWRDNLGDTLKSAGASVSLNSGKFDFERSARWHQVRMDFQGDLELTGVDIRGEPDGLE